METWKKSQCNNRIDLLHAHPPPASFHLADYIEMSYSRSSDNETGITGTQGSNTLREESDSGGRGEGGGRGGIAGKKGKRYFVFIFFRLDRIASLRRGLPLCCAMGEVIKNEEKRLKCVFSSHAHMLTCSCALLKGENIINSDIK